MAAPARRPDARQRRLPARADPVARTQRGSGAHVRGILWRPAGHRPAARLSRPEDNAMKRQSQIDLVRACLICVLAGIALAARGYGDEVYKTVDASGHVVYSDHPTSSAAQKVDVQVTQPDAAEAARLGKQRALEDAEFAQRSKQ